MSVRRRMLAALATASVLLVALACGAWWATRDPVRTSVPSASNAVAEATRGPSSSAADVATVSVDAPLAVLALDVDRFRFDPVRKQTERHGTIGQTQSGARLGEEVRLAARLSRPACCYLVAFNPDSRWQLCYPPNDQGKADATVRPPLAETIRYPNRETSYFSLTDGRGQQVFVLFAAREPLPAFEEWARCLDGVPWSQVSEGGVWSFDGDSVRPVYPEGGGKRGSETDRSPEKLSALCAFLKARAGVEVVSAVAFPVE